MGTLEDPFEPLVAEQTGDEFAVLARKPVAPAASFAAGVATGRLHGFDLDDQPLIASLPQLPGEIVAARSTVPLRRSMAGSEVVVVLEAGDPLKPIILGVIQEQPGAPSQEAGSRPIVEADGERYVIAAEREIVLRCGDASITLTRAGKVIIKGNYILSRSSGYNKIKGAAVDIN
jgi:hypothetical protein